MLVINERKVKQNHIRNTFYHNIVLIQLPFNPIMGSIKTWQM